MKERLSCGASFGTRPNLRSIDLLVCPSIEFDPFPTVLLEAGLVGLPVLASRVGGIPEIVEDNKTGLLITPADSRILTQAMEKLINDAQLRSTLGNNGRKAVEEKFNSEIQVKKVEQVFEELIGRR